MSKNQSGNDTVSQDAQGTIEGKADAAGLESGVSTEPKTTSAGIETETAVEEVAPIVETGAAQIDEKNQAPVKDEPESDPVGKEASALVEVESKPSTEESPGFEARPETVVAQGVASAKVKAEESLEDEPALKDVSAPAQAKSDVAVEPEPEPQKEVASGETGADVGIVTEVVSAASDSAEDESVSTEVEPDVAVEPEPAPTETEIQDAVEEETTFDETETETIVEKEIATVEIDAKQSIEEEVAPIEAEAQQDVDAVSATVQAEVVAGPAASGAEARVFERDVTPEPAGTEEEDTVEAAPAEPGQEEALDETAGEGEAAVEVEVGGEESPSHSDQEDRKRRRLLLALLALLALLLCVSAMFWRYLRQPAPLPDLLPVSANVNYPPHYLFSINGIDNPVGVAVSPEGDRIYVSETGGERLIKVFDRDGKALFSFAPPHTKPAQRAPVYLAVDATGWVYVTDRLQRAVFVYDHEGQHLDTILDPGLTLSEYVANQVGDLPPGSTLAYNLFESDVYYRLPGETEQSLPAPDPIAWAPLGVRIDRTSTLLLTDVATERHSVREIPGDVLLAATWQDFEPPEIRFGSSGHGNGEFLFPNVAVVDSQNRIYVTDGNNGRICVWDKMGEFLFSFGQGIGESALSLPRGAVMDARDRLHIVDTVEQSVKVFDVSGSEPRFLFAFGDWGLKEGEFNYPNDIALDASGRLYVADRENNRVQVWSY